MKNVTVTVANTALDAVTNASGVAVLTSVPSGSQTVRLQPVGSCAQGRGVVVDPATVVKVTIWNCGDVVELRNAPDEAAIALVDIRANVDGSMECVADRLMQGTGFFAITANALPLESCHGSVAVLTRDHAMYFAQAAGATAWTNELGDAMTIDLAPKPLIVPISFTVISDAEGETHANDQLLMAQDILSSELTGLLLAGSEAGGAIEFRHLSAALALVVGHGCASVPAIRANSSLYSPGRLNVFVVDSVVNGFERSVGGVTCIVEQAPEIIFFSSKFSKTSTLMHEIGHSLGLQRPIWGHTNGLSGFWSVSDKEPLNIMDDGRTLSGLYLSVGQVVRMTLSNESWLNRPSANDGTTLRQRQSTLGVLPISVPCGCPETVATENCTHLNTDIARWGKIRTTSTEIVTCGVISSEETIRVNCIDTSTWDMWVILQPVNAVGSTIFFSLSPAIVRVTLGPDDTKHWILTPVTNGAGQILVYADGSPQTFTVEVFGCP